MGDVVCVEGESDKGSSGVGGGDVVIVFGQLSIRTTVSIALQTCASSS